MEAPPSDVLVSAAMPKQPYPGLRPFESDEWLIFFGRETMVDDVIKRLGSQRVVLIHGASGSGKSSLVRAGVLPKLARQHRRHGVEWLTCAMRPSGGPLWNLASEFARLEGRADDAARIGQIIRLFNGRDASLASIVESLDGLAGKHLCILVDQFEELFRFERETSREEAELFVRLVIGQVADEVAIEVARELTGEDDGATGAPRTEPPNTNLHIAITMRSEFLGECARFSGFAEAVNRTQYLVPRMKYQALLRAIQRPAELYGGEITLALAERLIADVRGREDELPLIQHGLMLLWNSTAAKAPGRPISLDVAQFDRAGGLTQLLSDHANRVLVPPEYETNSVERLFRALTDINAEGRAIRRPQSFRELVAVSEVEEGTLRGIIDAFRADRVSLLTPYFPTAINDKTVIDISHEALIRCWNKIADRRSGWLQREFQDGLIWRSLLNDAREFEIDRRHILAPAAANQRIRWLDDRNPSWSARYGGGWELVVRLLEASRRSSLRSKRLRRLLLAPFLAGAAIGLGLMTAAFLEKSQWVDPIVLTVYVPTAVIMIFLLTQIFVDYVRQFVPSPKIRKRITWLITIFAGLGLVASIGFNTTDIVKTIFGTLFFFAAYGLGVRATMAAGSWLLFRPGRRRLPPFLAEVFEIEPILRHHRQTRTVAAYFDPETV